MTEIGLAQRRLLDDNSTCSDQQLPPTAPPAELMHYDHVKTQEPQMQKIGDNQVNAFDGGHEAEGRQVPEMPTEANNYVLHEEAVNGNGHGHGLSNRNIANGSISNDYTQSNGSYNFFESLKQSADTGTDNGNSNTGAQPKERTSHKSPYRSKSMQTTPQSPHDTEPNSSLLSSKLSRARSDNPTANASSSAHPHSSSRSTDELSAPVTIDVPPPKKRGRKRKHTSSEEQDQEDDELANSHDHKPEPKKQDKTEKRKPGRPRSHAKAQAQKAKDSQLNGHTENGPAEATEPKDIASNRNETAELTNPTKNNPPETETITNTEEPSTPTKPIPTPTSPKNPDPKPTFAIPTKPASSSNSNPSTQGPKTKKQKLKRSKTTSLTVKRTYSADVEDDVIWVDERPSRAPVDPKFKPSSEQSLSGSGSSSNVNGADGGSGKTELVKDDLPSTIQETQERDIQGGDSAANSTSNVEGVPGPKKRGRKRKKTSEQLAEEAQAQAQANDQAEEQAQAAETNIAAGQDEPTNTPAAEPQPDTTKQQPPIPEAQDTDVPMNAPEFESATNDNPNANATSDVNTSISPAKSTTGLAPETPKKQTPGIHEPGTDAEKENYKGPDKHSPISGTSNVPYRVGLSRRARIAPLLKMVRR